MSSHDDDLPEVFEGDLVPDGIGGPAAPGSAGFDIGSMMQMAHDMQAQVVEAQEQLASTLVEGTSGGGAVSLTLNGHLHLVGVRVDPGAIDPDDPSILDDLIRAAWQDAHDQVAALQEQSNPLGAMGDLGGMLDGGLGGLFGGS